LTTYNNQKAREGLRKLREERGGKCQFCKSTKKLQFAHIHGKETSISGHNSRGRKERYYDIKKHPDCYVLLCEDCHVKYDSNTIDLKSQQQLMEAAF